MNAAFPQGSSVPLTTRWRATAMRSAATVAAMVLLVVAAAVAPPAASAATITVDAERHGEAIHIHASAMLNADAATAWRVLTEYDRYPEFIPDLRVSRIVARRGASVTVEQSGDATLWLFKLPVDITFEIDEFPPNGLRSRAVAGTLRALASSYALTPVGSGVRLDYDGRVAPGFEFFGGIEQLAVRQNVGRQFQALADEIERRSAEVRGHSVAAAH
jgi:ribosome-associated toxin RatA of RatAB toxin-antitoxin module